ncbi:MAG: hypothetical protein ACRDLM_11010 [Gaiellaceae bacterium]
MNTFDDDTELDFFEEPRTLEKPVRSRRRIRPEGGGPRRPAPPPGAVGLARLAGLVALGIVVIVGLVFWVGSCQGHSKQEYASYLAKITPLAQSSARVGSDFANQLTTRNLTLGDLESKLEAWSSQEQLDYAAAQRIQPPGPLQAAHAQVLDVFQLRALGLAGLADTLTQAKSASTPPSGATVAADLAAQAQLLSASDVVWTELFRLPATETLAHEGVTGVIVPPSQIVTSPDIVSSRSLAILYGRLSTTSGGTGSGGGGTASGLHGSALVSTQAVEGGKTTTLSTSTPETIAVGSGLVIGVTFVDSGNYPEVQIPVTLDIIVSGRSVYTKTTNVAQIIAKQQTTASFSNIQVPPAAFGHSAKISVKIGQVPGEVRLDNNSATYPVFFSLAGP